MASLALANCAHPSTSQDNDVSSYIAKAMTDMALAARAAESCPDVSVDTAAVTRYEQSLDKYLADNGYEGEAKQKVMQEVTSNPEKYFIPWIDAFQKRYNVDPGDVQGFCKAIDTERASQSVIASLLD